MAETLVAFTERLLGPDGTYYRTRACGGVAADGLWEGWIEFVPEAPKPALRTPRETEQPNRDDLMYWAQGLTVAYLEGALDRARRAAEPRIEHASPIAPPLFAGPAPPRAAPPRVGRAVLDPFAVYVEGEHLLRSQLAALSRDHLEAIVLSYGLASQVPTAADVATTTIADAIVAAVRRRLGVSALPLGEPSAERTEERSP